MTIKETITGTLLKGKTDEGNLVIEDPRKHLNLFKDSMQEYMQLSPQGKTDIMDLFAGLLSIHDKVQISRKEVPRLSDSRLGCSRKNPPKNLPTLNKIGRQDKSYGCKFSCTLNHSTGMLSFFNHCEECLQDKETVDSIEKKLKVLQQITSPSKV